MNFRGITLVCRNVKDGTAKGEEKEKLTEKKLVR